MLTPDQVALIEGIKQQRPKLPEADIKKLIDKARSDGIDFQNEKDNSYTLFHYAILFENTTALNLLLKEKINLNVKDKNGNGALHFAILKLNDEAALSILRSGVKIDMNSTNNEGDTPLHLYAKGGDKRGIKLLSEFQHKFMANIYSANHKGETPLHCAITHDNMYFFTFFVNPLINRYYGQSGALALKNIQNPISGDNLVHVAVNRLSNTALEDNDARTYTILHLLASAEPSLFDQTNKAGLIKGSTPLDIFNKQGVSNKKIGNLLAHPSEVFTITQCDRQLLGILERNFNGTSKDMQKELSFVTKELAANKEELKSVQNELTEVKEQLSMLTMLLKQQLQLQTIQESTQQQFSAKFFTS
ncbi:ankyrin repeat domain-containing protein [Legionella longbeachae]|uniref:Ankyrin repeat protein n=1 Tax=Legionella longbeachae serogroup 1 (strain NSW150) TaxID=661367 RepID=D3HS51_LEGLN|nr:ankyrin repeat domain-containing protein [Legionella longbeachae]VEE02232.1 Ankyrin repeat protein [Legionella oakridgensis]HBD7399306.1 ankyrin repeat domain-containing protein [Legionella pneumophila]ARB91470.1 ankyrin repeat domain-containing protein [Legionella longbeachae]ARM32104.1 ankyrin repeat domain-containing protein [Legionella longbeachae]EEZ95130.1 ankyrin repeat-containing protein [Legionella longbeachae D-4968]